MSNFTRVTEGGRKSVLPAQLIGVLASTGRDGRYGIILEFDTPAGELAPVWIAADEAREMLAMVADCLKAIDARVNNVN